MLSRRLLYTAIALTIALLVIRLYAAAALGFGDAEALYAAYARHPQPVYRDHPGLIGVIARLVGGGDVPSPRAAHVLTAFLASAAPWVAAGAARLAGASSGGAVVCALAVMLTPEMSVGLFGLTPDLPLMLLWYVALGCAAAAERAPERSTVALALHLAAGFAAGLACDAKVSGGLLVIGLAVAWLTAPKHRRTLAPWAGLAVALVVVSPVVLDELRRGFPMLRHRLVDSQRGVGFSLRNVTAVAGGQLLYVTPPFLLAAWAVARDLHARRKHDASTRLLFWTTATCAPLVLLSCVSRVAEPHWIAPLYLALPLHLARRGEADRPLLSPALARWCFGVGAAVTSLAHAWVLLPFAPRLLGSAYVARFDLANDLIAWNAALPTVRRALALSLAPDEPPVVVVGPHWTVCAQLHAGLPASVLVGCAGDGHDDFSDWLPRDTWEHAPVLLYVTDDRFPASARGQLARGADHVWEVPVTRGGRLVRTVTITRLVSSARAARP